MGYYTRFEMSVMEESGGLLAPAKIPKELIDSLEDEIERMNIFDEGCVNPITKTATYSVYEKWYNHNNDMILLSSKYPEYIFLLEGIGEDYTDVWKAYFMNGKWFQTYATLVFDEYSNEKFELIEEIQEKYSNED